MIYLIMSRIGLRETALIFGDFDGVCPRADPIKSLDSYQR